MSDSQDFGARDGFAARDGDEGQIPAELQATHRHLQRDGAAWRTTVPDNARLNARVRTLPMELPQANRARERGRNRGAEVAAPRRAAHADASDSLLVEDLARGDTMRNGTIRKVGAWAAGASAMLVALLLVGLLVQMANGQAGRQRGFGSGTVSVGTPRATPYGQPTDAPTTGSKYVTSAVTARSVDNNDNAVNQTSTFTVGERVYVVVQVRNPPVGQHELSIKWYLNGQPVALPSEERSGETVNSATNAYFSLNYPQAGRGTARLYWDLPPNMPDSQADAFLARDVAFDVQGPASAPTATPLPGRTPTPGPTIVATPTQPPTPTPTPG